MKVIYKAPERDPEIRDIPNTLEELKAAVGGYIETVTVASDARIICNEEGRLQGLPYNCHICGVSFVGPVLIVGTSGEEFTDLDPDAMGLLMRGWEQLRMEQWNRRRLRRSWTSWRRPSGEIAGLAVRGGRNGEAKKED